MAGVPRPPGTVRVFQSAATGAIIGYVGLFRSRLRISVVVVRMLIEAYCGVSAWSSAAFREAKRTRSMRVTQVEIIIGAKRPSGRPARSSSLPRPEPV